MLTSISSLIPESPSSLYLLSLFLLPPLLLIPSILFFSHRAPLRAIPAAHPLAPYTSAWISYIRWRAIENATLRAAHARLGPVVCLGPREVSVNCVEGGIREVYGRGFEKENPMKEGENWYSFFGNYGGVPNMFSTGANKPHAARKRMLSNIYSKSTILSSSALLAQTSEIIHNRFLPYLSSTFSNPPQPSPSTSPSTPTQTHPPTAHLNTTPLLAATTTDIVSAYLFGLSAASHMLTPTLHAPSSELSQFLALYNSRRAYNFWPQEFPRLTAAVRRWTGYRLVPQWVDDANAQIERWVADMCDGAEVVRLRAPSQPDGSAMKEADSPVVYAQLSSALAKESAKTSPSPAAAETPTHPPKTIIASELLDHLAAGFDTSSITLTYLLWELSRPQNAHIQSALRSELCGISPALTRAAAPALPDPRALDALPWLGAVVQETLRLHAAIPGPQPRYTPVGGCVLGPPDGNAKAGSKECASSKRGTYFVPGGVRVSASAGLLHANEDVFERAGEWVPERWLDVQKDDKDSGEEMKRWFWAFGSGGRMCVGSHLAIYQIKYITAALYTNYSTSIAPGGDTQIAQIDAYTAPPGRDVLVLALQRVEE